MNLLLIAAAILVLIPTLVFGQTNFVVICFDDLRAWNDKWMETVYPNASLRAANLARLTPQLDRLEARAVSFSNAICTVPICNPTRIAFLTGIRPWQSGIYHNAGYWGNSEAVTTRATHLNSALKTAGYNTIGIGKIYLHSGTQGAQDSVNTNGWSTYIHTDHSTPPAPVTNDTYSVSGWFFGTSGLPADEMYDYGLAEFASNLLTVGTASHTDTVNEVLAEATISDPFALFVGFNGPHSPHYIQDGGALLTNFPTADMTGITSAWFSAIADDTNDLSAASLALLPYNIHVNLVAASPGDGGAAAYRSAIQHYMTDSMIVYGNMGRVLDALEASAYNSNTVVVAWSDSGFGLGDKTWAGAKSWPWAEIARSPFYVSDPFTSNQWGSTSAAICNLIDGYRTILDYAGITPGAYAGGESLRRFVEDPTLTEAGRWDYGQSAGNACNYFITADGLFLDTDKDGTVDEIYALNDEQSTTNLVGDSVWDTRAAQVVALSEFNEASDQWWLDAPSTMRIGPRTYPK